MKGKRKYEEVKYWRFSYMVTDGVEDVYADVKAEWPMSYQEYYWRLADVLRGSRWSIWKIVPRHKATLEEVMAAESLKSDGCQAI